MRVKMKSITATRFNLCEVDCIPGSPGRLAVNLISFFGADFRPVV